MEAGEQTTEGEGRAEEQKEKLHDRKERIGRISSRRIEGGRKRYKEKRKEDDNEYEEELRTERAKGVT